ncbi:enoyl-CoA hydratase [Sphingomonas sinipercae]|uniref:Enoyl-CoA hydratase n=1 Tax=Sphingomonas sinipercae TaxID=2714944 RepID=A0A6G7ZMZ3_9SPHN|nr:enoyl-CoA hydratase [Sphingomonas sinipercae]QIL02354.1 enoyl-CoA hydratase [Sphingomonas sinipercae]
MDEHVRIERDGGLLSLSLTRPERRNAITVAMYAALADAVESAAGDDSVRVIAIRGKGQDFTAGNDLFDFLNALPRAEDIPVTRLLRALACNPKPLVAAVQGNAVGIGTTLLLHCDLVIAEENARFSMPFVDLGLVPEAASSLLLPILAGRRRAASWLLLAEPFGAKEALEAGVISHIVPPGAGPQALDEMVQRLLRKPPEALKLTQRLLRQGGTDEVLARMDLETGLFAERLQSDEVKAAIASFFAGRGKS